MVSAFDLQNEIDSVKYSRERLMKIKELVVKTAGAGDEGLQGMDAIMQKFIIHGSFGSSAKMNSDVDFIVTPIIADRTPCGIYIGAPNPFYIPSDDFALICIDGPVDDKDPDEVSLIKKLIDGLNAEYGFYAGQRNGSMRYFEYAARPSKPVIYQCVYTLDKEALKTPDNVIGVVERLSSIHYIVQSYRWGKKGPNAEFRRKYPNIETTVKRILDDSKDYRY